MELLAACGNNRVKKVSFSGVPKEWSGELITLDFDENCNPDVFHDLNIFPYPFEDNKFDEVHIYEGLEHCGKQGDWRFFFDQFSEFWRILKPNGYFFATVPTWHGPWAWADPGHTRIISRESLIFLEQKNYETSIGTTNMTDYRHWYHADFEIISLAEEKDVFVFILKAKK